MCVSKAAEFTKKGLEAEGWEYVGYEQPFGAVTQQLDRLEIPQSDRKFIGAYDVPDLELSDEMRRWLANAEPMGYIVFARPKKKRSVPPQRVEVSKIPR